MSTLRTDQSKIDAVRAYLERKFPEYIIRDHHEGDRRTELFVVGSSSADALYECRFSREFLDDNSADVIAGKLEHWKVAEYLKSSSPVLVTSHGKHAIGRIGQ